MYINTDTNTYPLYPGDIMIAHPGWTTEDPLPNGWAPVVATEPPTISGNQMYYEEQPSLIDGVYHQVWSVRDLTPEELEIQQAPFTARQKLKTVVGLTDAEIEALVRGLR